VGKEWKGLLLGAVQEQNGAQAKRLQQDLPQAAQRPLPLLITITLTLN